ncbi:DUF4406 domain-containing protein [Epilithonimonas xixisoli]|uniref:Uncharacterized protein DUF4406 n=1 Tax=Epilithonimonas xixisoli TaxID=1476462 RepID=A0A4R8I855_9FLAO|nr:DUF4406 domain-containing protein [Epilithonimonas xixisoli]TDX86202.1 uncharacterized protein DUF4406 [Epilithonimonas xixisoli]
MKKKIYIAGKISGEDIIKCTHKFGTAQKEIEKQGFEALNPLELVGSWKVTWEDAMKICIGALVKADAILFLDDFTDSRGAMIEHKLASDLGIKTLRGTKELAKRV